MYREARPVPGARSIHCELNLPLRGIHRDYAYLGEGQRVVIRREVLENDVGVVRDRDPVYFTSGKRQAKTKIGTLEVDGQVTKPVPSDVGAGIL